MSSDVDKYREILQKYWGYEDFRGIQRDIIESIGSGRDTLGLMPTGGGKSITFQVPALAQEGVCIVVTPLIALMKDQVAHLKRQGIPAAAIYSGMPRKEIITKLENSIFGGVKILYISPERLSSDLFQTKLHHMNVSFITVDEAHCISQWGYDFRPSYLSIADIRQFLPGKPVLALTATATLAVVDDIQDKLGFTEKNVFRMSFERKNLIYVVRKVENKIGELIHILKSVNGSAIVYTRSRRHTKEIAQLLSSNDIESTFYHAGLDSSVKDQRQDQWQNDDVRVMVATNAFGMGIDKPDVRVVIHIDCPDSLEAYFQEAGRAGRDGQKSYAVLLYNNSDKIKLEKRITDNFPDKDYIREIYEHLAYYYQLGIASGAGHRFTFEIDKFCHTFKHFPVQVNSALHILSRSGYIEYDTNPDASARVWFLIGRNDLYRLDELSPHEDALVTALLRNYGGMFSDYVYIDEKFVADQAGLTSNQVYLILKVLSQRHILHFVPQSQTPYITYVLDRVDAEKLIIPTEVYEVRKEQYVKRINSVIRYATNDEICRSRQLLRYFGEKRSDDCNQCDVCLDHKTDQFSESRLLPIKQKILELLSDGKKHFITELFDLNCPTLQLEAAFQYLVDEEEIDIDGSYISLYK